VRAFPPSFVLLGRERGKEGGREECVYKRNSVKGQRLHLAHDRTCVFTALWSAFPYFVSSLRATSAIILEPACALSGLSACLPLVVFKKPAAES